MVIKKEVENIEAKIKAEVVKVDTKVKVELKHVSEGIHTVYMNSAVVKFENGVGEVEKEIAKELKELGLIK